MKFADLPIGAMFQFDYPGLAKGPWRKVSARRYTNADCAEVCIVDSAAAKVIRLADEPINLDAMTDDELRYIAKECAVCDYRRYAYQSLKAQQARLHGHICHAMEHEAKADKLYQRMPTPLKW